MDILDKELSSKILTLGPPFKNPKGGIAMVLNNYIKIYTKFNFIETTKVSNKIINTLTLLQALFLFIYKNLNKKIRIIHIHGASNISFYRKRIFINIAKIFNKKIVYHIHGGEFKEFYNKNKTQVKKTLSKCDVIIALSENWKSFFQDELNCKNVEVIHNIIPMPNIKDKIKFKENKINFLFLGALNNNKGIYDLLEVMFQNKDYLKDKINLYIGGNGEEKKVIDYIKNNGLNEFVHFEGWVSGSSKENLLNKSQVFILPSYKEGLPISILEAMSYGEAIISTRVGGIPEIVSSDNGVLIEPGNNNQIFDAIKKIIDNPDVIKDMAFHSLQKSKAYLPKNVTKELNNLYLKLL